MKIERDPPRFLRSGDCPPDLADALELARSELPRPGDLSAIEASLAPLLSRPRGPHPASIRPAATGAALGLKWLLAAAVAAASVGGIRYLRSSTAPAPASPAEVAPATARAPERTRAVAPTQSPASPSAEPEPSRAAAAPSRAVGSSNVEKPRASAEVAPVASSGRIASSGAFPDATGTDEVLLLERATRALGQDPASALALTEEHARRFPGGALAQEREFVAIEALEALGRTADATHRIEQFRARFPGSAHLRRLERLRTDGAR